MDGMVDRGVMASPYGVSVPVADPPPSIWPLITLFVPPIAWPYLLWLDRTLMVTVAPHPPQSSMKKAHTGADQHPTRGAAPEG